MFDDEFDGTDAVERRDGAAGDDGEIGCERRDGDQTEVGTVGEEFVGAQGRLCVMDLVALGEGGVAGRVLEVPHERSGIEEVDGGDADGVCGVQAQGISLCDAEAEGVNAVLQALGG